MNRELIIIEYNSLIDSILCRHIDSNIYLRYLILDEISIHTVDTRLEYLNIRKNVYIFFNDKDRLRFKHIQRNICEEYHRLLKKYK